MSANPERQGPTPLINAEIGQRVKDIFIPALAQMGEEARQNPNGPIKKEAIISFINNKLGEPRAPKR